MKRNSKKGFTLVEIMIVVVIIGLLAAMAIPAFQKVREQSREKTMINNLRNVASAGAQYILETGSTEVTYTKLIDDNYMPEIKDVAGEGYSTLIVSEDGGTLDVETDGGQTAEFEY